MVIYRTKFQQSDSDTSISSADTSLHAQQAPVRCRWYKCGEWFSQLESLVSHVTNVHAVSGKGGLYYCGWEGCVRNNRGFNARYKMLVHVRTHTNEKPHHCYQCEKSFSRAENLKIHSRSHTGERPYVCPVTGCGKAYSNSSDRFKHTRTHSVEKPYVCKVPGCPKRYTDPSSLRKHVKTFRHFPTTVILTPVSQDVQETEIKHKPEQMDVDLNDKKLFIDETKIKQEPVVTIKTENNYSDEDNRYLLDRQRETMLELEQRRYQRKWPGVIWWICAEQETPLDLTCHIKPHNDS